MRKDIIELKKIIATATWDEPGIFAVALINPGTGQELSVGSQRMRSASLIKLFIMAEAFSQIAARTLLPDEEIVFNESDRVGGAGILQNLPSGSCHSALELIELMITESDNIATNLLIDKLGMDAINARISKTGCSESVLRRRMMDFTAAAAGRENLTSALDIAKVFRLVLHGQCVSAAADACMRDILGRQTDRCKIPLHLPPDTLCQHKTGELPGAEHDAGIVYSPAGPYVVAIMSDNLPDPERGRQAVSKLSRAIYDFFTTH